MSKLTARECVLSPHSRLLASDHLDPVVWAMCSFCKTRWGENAVRRGTDLFMRGRRGHTMTCGVSSSPSPSLTWNSVGYCAKGQVHWPRQKSEEASFDSGLLVPSPQRVWISSPGFLQFCNPRQSFIMKTLVFLLFLCVCSFEKPFSRNCSPHVIIAISST